MKYKRSKNSTRYFLQRFKQWQPQAVVQCTIKLASLYWHSEVYLHSLGVAAQITFCPSDVVDFGSIGPKWTPVDFGSIGPKWTGVADLLWKFHEILLQPFSCGSAKKVTKSTENNARLLSMWIGIDILTVEHFYSPRTYSPRVIRLPT